MSALFLLVFNILTVVLLFIFLRDKIIAYKKERLKKSNFFITRTGKWFTALGLLAVIPISFLFLTVDEYRNFESLDEKITFYEEAEFYSGLSYVIRDSIKDDIGNPVLLYKYVNTINQYYWTLDRTSQVTLKDLEDYKFVKQIKGVLHIISSAESDSISNYGRLFKSVYNLTFRKNKLGKSQLDSLPISLHEDEHFQFAKTLYFYSFYYKEKFKNKALDGIEKIENSETYHETASRMKANIFYYHEMDEELIELVKNSDSVSSYLKRYAYLINLDILNYLKTVVFSRRSYNNTLGIIAAIVICIIWLIFIYKLDIYEPERIKHVLITFFLGCISLHILYPLNDFTRFFLGYYSSDEPIFDFLHMFITIGVFEELVKIIPFLLMLKFSKAINEPYDYILYSSISALAFAFIENIGYFEYGQLQSITTRGVYTSVGHMFMSSTIGYGLMLTKYHNKLNSNLIFLLFFILASGIHTFYDFWLLNPWAFQYQWITTLFFLISVHVWFIYINNSLNISNFYNPKIEIQNDNYRFYLISSLIFIMLISFVFNSIDWGREYGIDYLKRDYFLYSFLILYISFTLSKFNIIRGYLAPINVPLNFFIPRVREKANYEGLHVKIIKSLRTKFIRRHEDLIPQFPIQGTLVERLAINGNLNSYLVKISTPLIKNEEEHPFVIVMDKSKNKNLNDSGNVLIHIFLVTDINVLSEPIIQRAKLDFIGWAYSFKLAPISND